MCLGLGVSSLLCDLCDLCVLRELCAIFFLRFAFLFSENLKLTTDY